VGRCEARRRGPPFQKHLMNSRHGGVPGRVMLTERFPKSEAEKRGGTITEPPGRPKWYRLPTPTCSGRRAHRRALHLTSEDRSMVGITLCTRSRLIGAALSLSSGGSVIVRRVFQLPTFGNRSVSITRPGTPPCLLFINAFGKADRDGAPHSGPRFIRSCSAALAPTILTKLENRFGAPV